SSDEAFFSRLAFAKLNWYVWLDHLFLGVGMGAFPQHVPMYAEKLGLPLGTWTDNTNNFYMGLLSETGMLGALAFLATALQLRWVPEESRFYRWAVVVFAVLLLFGPHVHFGEVSVLLAFILSCAVTPVVRKRRVVGANVFF